MFATDTEERPDPPSCECCGAVPPCESYDECLVACGNATREQLEQARQPRPQVCNDRGAPGVDDCDCECHAAGLPPCDQCRETADDDGRDDEVKP